MFPGSLKNLNEIYMLYKGSLNICLTCRDGWASRRPTYLEGSPWAGAQSPVSDGQQVTEEGECLPFLPQKDRAFPGLHLSRVIPGSPGLLSAQVKAPGVVPEHLWGGPALDLSLNLFTCTFCPLGMPMLSVQTCGIVCMLVSLITLWKHPSVYPVLQRLCACMKTHTHTLLQFSRLPPFSWLWPCRVPEKMFRILGGAASLPRRGSHKWPNGLCQLPDRECFLQACVFLAPLSSFFVLFFFKKSSFSHKCCLYEKQPEVLSCTFWWAFPSGRRWRPHRVGGGGGGTTARIALGCKEWTALSATWWPRHVYSLFQVRINRQSTNWRKKSTLSETIYRWGFEIRSALCIYLKVTFKPNSLILCQHLYIYVITVGISC